MTKWDKWTAITKRHIHNIWCTSDINKSVPAGSLFSSTPADFFAENQDFCLLCLFSFLKWFRHINSCNAFPRSATKSKMPVEVVHYTSNLSLTYLWRVHSELNSTKYSSWCLSVLLVPNCHCKRRWLFCGSCVLPTNFVLIIIILIYRVSRNLRLLKYIHAWATHWTDTAEVSCTLQTCI